MLKYSLLQGFKKSWNTKEKTKHKYLWSLIFKGFVTLSISPGLLSTQMLKSLEWECAFTRVRDVCSLQPADVYREKSCGGWGWALRKLQNWAWVPWWSRTELLVMHSLQKDERNIFLNGSHVTSCGNDKFSQSKWRIWEKIKKLKFNSHEKIMKTKSLSLFFFFFILRKSMSQLYLYIPEQVRPPLCGKRNWQPRGDIF